MMASFAAASTGCGLSKPKVDGEYEAELDITPLINAALVSMMNDAGVDVDEDDFSGEVTVKYLLELDDGEYTLTIDYESYIEDYRDYVQDNLVPVYADYLYDELDAWGYSVDDFLSAYGYDSIEEYCEDEISYSVDVAAADIENDEIEGDYKVKSSGLGSAYVELDYGTTLYYEKGNLVGHIDKDLLEDIEDADDIDELIDAFEDNDADDSLVDVCNLCDSYGITADDFKDWLEDSGLADDGLVYEAQ